MSYRLEKKFRVTVGEFISLQNQLLKQGMVRLYESRKIRSLYFDSRNLGMFNDSEEGILPRKKVRVRYYNDESKFSFEKKISSIEGRYKQTKSLKHLSCVSDLLNEKFFDNQYGLITPSLLVNYDRAYFSFKSMRITFDCNISYSAHYDRFKKISRDPENVVEIKVLPNVPEDYIFSHVPYATSRFSKYSRGLLICSGAMNGW